MPSNRMCEAAAYTCSMAAGTRSAVAVTPSTRPPAVTNRPSHIAVPAWETTTPGTRSASSIPSIGAPVGWRPGYPPDATTTQTAARAVGAGAGNGAPRAAVGDRKERRLLAAQKLLDHDGGAGRPELPALQAARDGRLGLGERRAHDGALARGEPIGLDDHRRPELARERARGVGIGERRVARRRNARARHQIFREGLAAFERGGGRARPEHGKAFVAQAVGETGNQRHLGPDDDEVGALALGEPHDAVVVVDAHRHAHGAPGDAGIARRRHQTREPRALGELPAERVLAAAAADDEQVHSGLVSV